MNAAGFLAAIRAGQHDICLILADWLEEQGKDREAKRLRTRYRRWLNQTAPVRDRAEADRKALLATWRPTLDAIRASGGKATIEITVIPDTAHEDALLVAYVERLLSEFDYSVAVPPRRI